MKFDMTSMDGAAAGSLELDEAVFGLEPRGDLIARMVRWQLAKRQAGDHKTLDARTFIGPARRCTSRRAPGRASRIGACAAVRGGGRAMVLSFTATRTICPRRCARWRCAMRCPPRFARAN